MHWALVSIVFDKKTYKVRKKLDLMAGLSLSLDKNLNFWVSYTKIGSCCVRATAHSPGEFDIDHCRKVGDTFKLKLSPVSTYEKLMHVTQNEIFTEVWKCQQ